MAKTKKIFFLIIIVVIMVIAGLFVYRVLTKSTEGPNAPGSVVTEMLDLDKKIVVPDNYTEEQKQKFIEDIDSIRSELKEDSDYLQNWLQLGLLYKAIEDYWSAKEVWEYVTVIRPNDSIAFHNLGDLYHLYLPDFPLAEKNYLKAIELDPKPFFYQKLCELYAYSYKEKKDAVEPLLLDGVEKNPSDALLFYLLAQYYEENNDVSAAVEYYEKVLDLDPFNETLRQHIEKLKNK